MAYLVNVAEDGLLDTLVLDNLTEDATVTATNDQHLLGVGMRVHGQVGDHLLVRELIALGALDDIVQDQDVAVVGGLEDQDILIQALLVVQHLLDLESHGLAWRKGSVTITDCSPLPGARVFTNLATSPRSHGTTHLHACATPRGNLVSRVPHG